MSNTCLPAGLISKTKIIIPKICLNSPLVKGESPEREGDLIPYRHIQTKILRRSHPSCRRPNSKIKLHTSNFQRG